MVSAGGDKRKHPRYATRLGVRYANAEQFVTDYVENLSEGGLFIAGAHQMPMGTETDVQVELPGQGSWSVRARIVFLIDPTAAETTGRKAGAGMQIIDKPPGFDDALLGYLLRLGRRRDHAVMLGDGVIGAQLFEDAGYRVMPLESEDEVAFAMANGDDAIVAVVLPPTLVQNYRDRLGERGKEVVFSAVSIEEIHDILARIDALL
jgi:Tfp pilus assembly protein PilZ